MTPGRRLLLVVMLMAAVAGMGAARAEPRLEPAFGEASLAGPAKARGALIYNHAKDDPRRVDMALPPYLEVLRAAGWDIWRLVRPDFRSDLVPASTEALLAAAFELKARGYGRLAAAGQSYGGWIALNAAARAPGLFETVVATAPAAFGKVGISPKWRRNAELAAVAGSIAPPTRVMVFLFEGDAYDPGARAAPLRLALRKAGVGHRVVDRPRGHRGHGAARSPAFAREFGRCIARFLGGDAVCPPVPARDHLARLSLPPDLAPASPPPEGMAPLWGRWVGWLGNGRDVFVALEKAGDRDRITAVYAWSALPDGSDRPRWLRREDGRMENGSFVMRDRKMALRLTPLGDGSARLAWTRPDGGGRLEALMMRVE